MSFGNGETERVAELTATINRLQEEIREAAREARKWRTRAGDFEALYYALRDSRAARKAEAELTALRALVAEWHDLALSLRYFVVSRARIQAQIPVGAEQPPSMRQAREWLERYDTAYEREAVLCQTKEQK